MQEVNFDVVRGDDFIKAVQFKDDDDVVIDISSWTALTATLIDIDGEAIAEFTIEVLDAPNGIIRLSLAASITDDLIGAYNWDFQRTLSEKVKTMMGGYINFTADVAVV